MPHLKRQNVKLFFQAPSPTEYRLRLRATRSFLSPFAPSYLSYSTLPFLKNLVLKLAAKISWCSRGTQKF